MENQKVMPLGQLFRKSLEVYKGKFKILTKISALEFLVWVVMAPCIGLFVGLNYNFLFSSGPFHLIQFIIGSIFLLIGGVISIILGLWIFTSLFYVIKQSDNNAKLKEAMSVGWHNLASFFWVGLLKGVITLIGFVIFIIPGIVFAIWFSFASYVFVFENIKGFDALKKSRKLVRGYWWPIFWRMAAIALIDILISVVFKNFVGSIITVLFVTPYILVYLSTLYQDLKNIKA